MATQPLSLSGLLRRTLSEALSAYSDRQLLEGFAEGLEFQQKSHYFEKISLALLRVALVA